MKFILAIFIAVAAVDAKDAKSQQGFCSYPMWSIPEVGTDTRCDNGRGGCPKRIDEVASPDCADSFGTMGGSSCFVRCAHDADGTDKTEEWKCSETDYETWELVGDEISCSSPRLANLRGALKDAVASATKNVLSGNVPNIRVNNAH
mmetsp:Transcript_31350/g.62147  ORF Transcript_31350/g.62147 Transcript_31350/m.62147 type:complete len:147 (-) Transcript_31350:432-872(-)|eukprot:CAMPEP_0197569786 /NCGR_PEP_ID=MMETSP1320-20131121/39618_1 /TAXON_ID=91990 /ORGANISM="Bolidomonas sp., Strain RCC2347" /LENGTH=146 /DNA_ID=CAMNT_0043132179 /DNA_START=22 /DNA_END=462 /DNA_ORIENTATION=+